MYSFMGVGLCDLASTNTVASAIMKLNKSGLQQEKQNCGPMEKKGARGGSVRKGGGGGV